MSVRVRIPTQLRPFTRGLSEVEADGANVGEVITALGESYPGITERMFDDAGTLRRFVNIYLGDEDIRFLEGLITPVGEDDHLAIIPAVAGGSS